MKNMPKVFGWQHLVYVAIAVTIMIISFIIINKKTKTEKDIRNVIRFVGFLLLAAIIWNRISICVNGGTFKHILPESYCGLSSLLLSLAAIFLPRNHKVFHCIAYTGLLGSFLTLVYPDFIGQADSIFYSKTISGLMHHTIMFFLVVLMFKTKFIVPDLKKWYILPLGLCLYVVYGIFLITILDYSNAMYIYEPILPGTPLNWFVLGIIFMGLYMTFLIIWDKKIKPKLKLRINFHK
jgi:uncharacterized membrane protein YwaF